MPQITPKEFGENISRCCEVLTDQLKFISRTPLTEDVARETERLLQQLSGAAEFWKRK